VKVTQERMLWKSIKARLLSFGLVISIAFLMLISLLITTALTAFSSWLKGYLPDFMVFIFYLLDFTISLAFISVLFALMFKILPDVRIRWRDVWIGAIATALLFMIGKAGLGIYFGKAEPASIYGAAGSIILIMLWVSYSCMILFFGAEFTKQFTLYYGGKLIPKRGAELILRDEIDQKVREKREAAQKSKE
jgi:membrane protein